jgi:surface antigen/phage tail protein X
MTNAIQKLSAIKLQRKPVKKNRASSTKIKPSAVAIYASVFVLIITVISVGYHEPKETNSVANTTNASSTSVIDETSVDNVVATGVAAAVAQVANLPVATSVANLAVSAQTKSEFAQADTVNVAKPQIIELGSSNRSVTTYATKAGDTVDSLAVQFGISKDTIKWANNLTSDALSEGKMLKILPVDGVLYNVRVGDTIDSIASKYSVDKTRLILYNDLDVSGLTPSTSIILPNAVLPNNERPGYVAPVTNNYYYYAGQGAGFGGQTWRISIGTPDGPYAHGNCTLYAYNRRKALGLPVGSNWGNASSWAANARQDGLLVNNTPSAGAIIQNGGYLGHVGIVESILANGDLSISEMNAYVPGGGYNIVSGRIIPAANIGQYLYIH